jgi:hypothetical protein
MPSFRLGFLFGLGVLGLVAALLAQSVAPTAADPSHAHDSATTPSAASIAFERTMRALWEDHITWTRLFIVDFTATSPEIDATTQRLLKNQVDIGNAIKPFYGDDAGEALNALLTDHILGAADLLAAAKAGDTARIDEASKRWYANGDAIATFLNTANPEFWPLDEMKAMMKDHLDLTLAEAVAHLNGDWPADIAAYDTVHKQILDMADMLSAGIINQFPEQFA